MFELVPLWFFYLGLVLFGLAFGSFANVVIWRLPRRESLSQPPSHCPKCGHRIAWYDNVPVLSWVLLRARCRSCHEPISGRYPVVEALTAGLWLAAGVQFGITWQCAAAVALYYLLLLLAFIDFDTGLLPDMLVGILAAVGFVGAVMAGLTGQSVVPLLASGGALASPVPAALAGAALGVGVTLGIGWVYRLARSTDGLGMGDVKLLGAIGLFTGPYVLLVLFFGSVLGSVYGLVLTRRSSDGMRTRFAFGPFLAIAAVITVMAGTRVMGWYLGILR